MTYKTHLEAALAYNAAGFSVIPLRPRSKLPMYSGWNRYSTIRSTQAEIERWWKETPDANIGIVCGPANGEDGRYLFVVDQDLLKDEKTHKPIVNEDGSFKQKGDIRGCPVTLSQTTGSGGQQFFYWAPQGYEVGNSKPRPLIDVKGLNGFVMVPPSIHPDTGKEYAWNETFERGSIAEFPQDALDSLLGERASSKSSVQKVLAGVPVGHGLRHMAAAQVAGLLLQNARTPEEQHLARLTLYTWDREVNKSPEPWLERQRELDATFDGILKKEMSKPEWHKPQSKQADFSFSAQPILVKLADVISEAISWLWQNRFALGKLSMIIGDPDVGKSLVTMFIAAVTSRGGLWPVDRTQSPTADVILLSAEDGAEDTIKPRLEAAGADLQRVHILQAMRVKKPNGSESERMFSLEHDLAAIEKLLDSHPECKLVVIDPISAYLGQTDSHRNAAVRGLLAPLSRLAAKRKVAIIVVDHLNKNSREGNALYRSGGSLAFVAAARAVFLVARDPENITRRLVVPIKNNIAKEQEKPSLAYSISTAPNGAPVIEWEPEPLALKARDLLAQWQTTETKADTDWAVIFLEDLLENGPVSSVDVNSAAKKEKITEKQLRRAAAKLGIQPKKTGFKSGWTWALPGREHVQDAEGAQNAAEDTMGTLDKDAPEAA